MVSNDTGESKSRPTEYSAEIGEAICERLAADGQSIYKICSDPGMPTRATLREWLIMNSEFRNKFAFAEWFALQWLEDELIEIVDTISEQVEKVQRDGRVTIDIDAKNFARTRLRLDVRGWVADQRYPNAAAKFTISRKGYGK